MPPPAGPAPAERAFASKPGALPAELQDPPEYGDHEIPGQPFVGGRSASPFDHDSFLTNVADRSESLGPELDGPLSGPHALPEITDDPAVQGA